MKFSDITNNIKKIENQKTHAKKLLEAVSEHFEFALIAGGAPRNWAYNRPANDFDIYVCRKAGLIHSEQTKVDKKIAKSIKVLGKQFGFGANRAAQGVVINSNAYAGFILNSLYDFGSRDEESNDHQNCQFIVIDDYDNRVHDEKSLSERIFATYDFGICMTSMDKDGNFYNDQLFESDVANKTFTCNIRELRRNNNSGMKKLVERFHKMEDYFPDHKMRIME